MKEPLQDRISRRVLQESECIVWQGARDQWGYGIMQVDGKPERVHRVVWFISHGRIPRGVVVRHAVCDNPPCCRLDHLALGTHKDNAADRVAHGRQKNVRGDQHGLRLHPEAIRRGELNGNAKVTDAQIQEIVGIHAAGGRTQRSVAAEFGISQIQVSRIVRGVSRSHRWLRKPQESPA